MGAGAQEAARRRLDAAASGRLHRRARRQRLGRRSGARRRHVGPVLLPPAPRRASPAFAGAWEAAIHEASKRLADIAFERAINGVDEPVLDKDGRCIYVRTRYNDRLLMFLLRAHQPERYRHAHQSGRHPAEPEPPATPPVEEAMRALEPVPPADPHRLMPPDELETELECADILDGRLPHWYRYDRDLGPPPPDEEFERMLAAAKGEAPWAAPRPDPDGED